MYCQSCGKKIEKDVKFCSHCGASISNLKDTPDQSQAPQEVAVNMHAESSKPVVVCAFGLLVAFFMPWVQLFGNSISGYDLGRLGSYGNYAWVIPILAGATILLSFSGTKNLAIGAITGIVPLGAILYGLVRLGGEGGSNATKGVLDMAGQVLSIGAWLTIIFSIAIIIAAKNANKKMASSAGTNINTNFGNPSIQQPSTTQTINPQPQVQQQYTPPVQQPQTIQTPSPSFREQIAPIAEKPATTTDVKQSSEAEQKKDMASSPESNEERLILAAKEGDVQTVKALLDAGTDVNATVEGYAGMTPLMHASRSNHIGCVKVLISARANVRMKNELGRTALKIAEGNGYHEIVKLLKEAGA